MKYKVLINKKFVDAGKACISVFDRGFMYGDAVFETMRSYAGTVFKLGEHTDRLYKSLRIVEIKKPCSKERLEHLIYKTLKINKLANAYVKVSVTRGEGRLGIGCADVLTPNLIIIAKNFDGYPARMHERGIRVVRATLRQNESSVLSGIKSHNFLSYILARSEAQDRGCEEAIIVNTKGHVAEAVTSNIFLVRKGVLITPSLASGILPGITRKTVIDIARRLKIRVRERTVSYKELANADEVFLTNSLSEILPVIKVGTRRIGDGRPGRFTKLLYSAYRQEAVTSTAR